MKMVKSLLLGSAAGLVAVSVGQAADLPVKTKPVQYVKVCSLYGAGFYYMPGTDICLKIGGYVRAETTYHSNGNFAAGPTGGDVNNRTTNEFVMRARAYSTADARETAWGTARALCCRRCCHHRRRQRTDSIYSRLQPRLHSMGGNNRWYHPVVLGLHELRCGLLPCLLAELRYR